MIAIILITILSSFAKYAKYIFTLNNNFFYQCYARFKYLSLSSIYDYCIYYAVITISLIF